MLRIMLKNSFSSLIMGWNATMQEKDSLSLVAVHSDACLLSVAFYFGARFGFDKFDNKKP
ncbi:PHD finger protein ALFIN-LIKE 9 [Linum grandiflorum]